MRSSYLCIAFVVVSGLIVQTSHAEDWPQFRGADSRGVVEHVVLPDRWSATENIRWKTPIDGRGWSSPIVIGNRIVLTSVVSDAPPAIASKGLYFGGERSDVPDVDHTWHVLCLDANDGRILWDRVVHQGKPARPRHVKNSYSSETPISDGERVYALFGDIGLFCLSLEGEVLWSREQQPYKTRYDWGPAASPVLHEDWVYLVNDNEEQSYLQALDKRTGDEVWRVERDEGSNWATPYIWKNEIRTEIITPGSNKVRSYNLDGELLYEFAGHSSITIATPYAAHGFLYVSSGYILDKQRPIYAVRPGAAGDITLAADQNLSEFIAWRQNEAAPYNPSTLVQGDILYVLLDRGFFSAYHAKTGEELYSKQRLPGGRAFTASPWANGDKIFCLNEYGETFVVAAGREFKLLHTNKLGDGEMCMATPAVAGDSLLIRTETALYSIAEGHLNADYPPAK